LRGGEVELPTNGSHFGDLHDGHRDSLVRTLLFPPATETGGTDFALGDEPPITRLLGSAWRRCIGLSLVSTDVGTVGFPGSSQKLPNRWARWRSCSVPIMIGGSSRTSQGVHDGPIDPLKCELGGQIVDLQYEYVAHRFQPRGGSDQSLLLFVAPATEIRTWAGVPLRAFDYQHGFQRTLNPGRVNDVIQYFREDPKNIYQRLSWSALQARSPWNLFLEKPRLAALQ
jgi:hypothetical protein